MNKLTLTFAAALACATATPAMAQDIPNETYRIQPTPQELEVQERDRVRKLAYKWEAAYAVASAADLIITVQAVNSGKFVEANPVAKNHSMTEMIIIKTVLTAGHVAFTYRLAQKHPRAALRFAQISAIAQGGVVGLNIRTVF